MAPLNPNATDRLKVTYQNAISEHTAQIRIASSADITDAMDTMASVLTALTTFFCFNEVTGVEYAAAGVDVFNPIDAGAFVGYTWGDGAADRLLNPIAATFVGRSGAGKRVRWSVFGYNNPISEYRLTAGEDGNVGIAVALLNAAETTFLAIDGQPAIWKNYLDIKANDHWVGKSRG